MEISKQVKEYKLTDKKVYQAPKLESISILKSTLGPGGEEFDGTDYEASTAS